MYAECSRELQALLKHVHWLNLLLSDDSGVNFLQTSSELTTNYATGTVDVIACLAEQIILKQSFKTANQSAYMMHFATNSQTNTQHCRQNEEAI